MYLNRFKHRCYQQLSQLLVIAVVRVMPSPSESPLVTPRVDMSRSPGDALTSTTTDSRLRQEYQAERRRREEGNAYSRGQGDVCSVFVW